MTEKRATPRLRVYLGAVIEHPHVLSRTACTIRNLSAGGASIGLSAAVPVPDRFDLVVSARGTRLPVETVWRRGDRIGLRLVPAVRQPETPIGPDTFCAGPTPGDMVH